MRIELDLEGRARADDFYFALMDGVWGAINETRASGFIDVSREDSKFVLLRAATRGYWSKLLDLRKINEAAHVTSLRKIECSGPLGWWHALHNIYASDLSRGAGIKIGVIDRSLNAQRERSCISHVVNAELHRTVPRALLCQPHMHSSAVCSLIASRCESEFGFQGIAPGAEVVFIAAADSVKSRRLSISRVVNAIERLAVEFKCDLISVSAGIDKPVESVRNAMLEAFDAGALCLFPTGNYRIEKPVMYPAAYSEALSVAAIGRRMFAPQDTYEYFDDRTSLHEAIPDHYWWFQSCLNGRVDLVAGGANVVWTQESESYGAVSGTSFACPVATAAAAVVLGRDATYLGLSRDRSRSEYARAAILRASTGIHPPPTVLPAHAGNCGILSARG